MTMKLLIGATDLQTITHMKMKSGKRVAFRILFSRNKRRVGFAAFTFQGNNALQPEFVSVSPKYRRQGLATELWRLAANLTHSRIVKPARMTKDGEALWNRWNHTSHP